MNKPLIICEAGNCHEGSLETALQMLAVAKECGVDIFKMQAGTAAGFARSKEDIKDYKKYELGLKGYRYLVEKANEIGIPIMFSIWPIDRWVWKEFRKLDYFKIAARQCNIDNIARYATAGKKTFISIPSTMKIANVKLLELYGAYIPMHCVSEYPTWVPQLERILDLQMALNMDIGYSDHTIGLEAAKEAIKMGAIAIEKHFTLDKGTIGLRDHKISADPADMTELVKFAQKYKRGTIE